MARTTDIIIWDNGLCVWAEDGEGKVIDEYVNVREAWDSLTERFPHIHIEVIRYAENPSR